MRTERRASVDSVIKGHVAYVTIDRPDRLNALDRATHAALGRVWDRIEADDAVRVVVLTGAGERSFCVGQDLRELADQVRAGVPPTTFGSRGLPGWPRFTERLDFAKPVIARVNGYAYGGGFELALACDIVVAAEHATFALPEAKLGLVAGAGGVFRLARQLPLKMAMGHLLTGRPIAAPRALELGLVNDVVPLEQLDACVDGWVHDILLCSPAAVRATKEAAMRSLDMPLGDAFLATYAWETARLAGDEAREGPLAFVDKREPYWVPRDACVATIGPDSK